MSTRRKYTELDIDKKMEIIALIDKKVSQRALAQQFAISKTTVMNIGKNKKQILEMSREKFSRKRKRKVRKTYNEPVNSAVWKFLEHCRSNDIPVNGVLLQKKAKEFAEKLMIENFQASNGWLESFIRRNNISLKALAGADKADAVAKDNQRKNFEIPQVVTLDRVYCSKEHTTELTWPEPDEASFESPIVLKEDNSSEVPPFTSESQYNRSVLSKRSLQSSLDYESLSTEVLLTLKNQLNHQDDRFDIFAKNIAMKLRELPYQQRLLAEKIINDTLFEAEMGNLTMSHGIMPTSQHQHLTSRMSTSSRPILHQKRSMQQQIHSQHSATTTDISKDSTSLFISKASGTPAKTNNSQKSDAEHQESRRIAFKRTVSDSQDESNESSRDNTDYPTDIKSRNSLLSAPTSMPFEFVSALPIKVEPEEGDDYLEQQTSSNSQNYYSYPS